MRFVQFCHKGNIQKLGVQLKIGGDIIDLSAADSSFPNSLLQFLNGGKPLWDKAKTITKEIPPTVPFGEVKLLSPITSPDKIACVALNYKDHCEETGSAVPAEPVFFSKFSSCIIGPFENIKYPAASDTVDWEVELAVIIGKKGYNVPESEAMDLVFGYTMAQDISARDWQKKLNGSQFLLGKAMDTFCPLGPAVVTKETIPNVYDLKLKTTVNGHVKQDSNTTHLIHKIDKIISRFSRCVTLLPGDVILTGTPAGVGAGRSPPEFLKPGDIIRSEIDQIGAMENKIVKPEMWSIYKREFSCPVDTKVITKDREKGGKYYCMYSNLVVVVRQQYTRHQPLSCRDAGQQVSSAESSCQLLYLRDVKAIGWCRKTTFPPNNLHFENL